MGKVKTVVMGDEKAEEAARRKSEAKREQKRLTKRKAESIEHKDSEKGEKEQVQIQVQEQEKEKEKEKEQVQEQAPEEKKLKKTGEKSTLGRSAAGRKLSHGKTYLQMKSLVDKNKTYPLSEAIELVKKTTFSKFDGTMELHANLTEKGVRGVVALPHGTGKEIRIRIADEKLITDLEKGGNIDFDILVAHPTLMPKLAKIAKILGPKGLMPNPKTGTIGENPEELAKKLSTGQIQFKTETEAPIVHTILGKVSFADKDLVENAEALIKAIGRERIKSLFLKSTMSPAVRVQV